MFPLYVEELKGKLIDRLEKHPDTKTVNVIPSQPISPYFEELLKIEEDFGIVSENFTVHQDKIYSKQFLSDILRKCNADEHQITQVAKQAKGVFDLTQLRAGNTYYVLCDSIQQIQYFIYEDTPTDYVVFDLQDSTNVYTCEKKTESRLFTTSGIITTNLYSTLAANEVNPALAIQLSEVFAWSIDFFNIHKNDHFKAIYEEKYVDGKSAGLGELKAAYFSHAGQEYYAFLFEKDTISNYFDEEGHSVKKAFLKAPLKFSRISSRYSGRRYHPVLRRYKSHLGTDYAASRGTPVRAVGDGTVVAARYHRANGRYVKIKHNSVYSTQYLHFSRFGKGIKKGVRVKQGQVIGYVGSTGLATGPHLCFRFWKNGKQIDHFKEKMPPAEPIPAEYASVYETHRDSVKSILDEITYPIAVQKTENETLP